MGTSQSAVARFEAGDLDVRLSTLDRYSTAAWGPAGMEDRAWVIVSKEWLVAAPRPGRGHRCGGNGAPSPFPRRWRAGCWPSGVVLVHGLSRRPLGHPCLGGAMTLDAEGDEPVTLRADCGEAGLCSGPHADGCDRADGRAGAGAMPGAGGRRRDRGRGRLRPPVPLPCRAPGSSLCEPATQHEAHVRNVAHWVDFRRPSVVASASAPAPPPGSRPLTSSGTWSTDAFLSAAEGGSGTPVTKCPWPDAAVHGGLPDRVAAHGVPSAPLTPAGGPMQKTRWGPRPLRCGDVDNRSPHSTPPGWRVGRAADQGAGDSPGGIRDDAHLRHPGPFLDPELFRRWLASEGVRPAGGCRAGSASW